MSNFDIADSIAQPDKLIDAAIKTLRGSADQARDDHGRWAAESAGGPKQVESIQGTHNKFEGESRSGQRLRAVGISTVGKLSSITSQSHAALLAAGYKHTETSRYNSPGPNEGPSSEHNLYASKDGAMKS